MAIAICAKNFPEFLAWAHAIDQHFCSAPLEANLPVRLSLIDVWYRNFHCISSRSIPPTTAPCAADPPTSSSWRRKAKASARSLSGVGAAWPSSMSGSSVPAKIPGRSWHALNGQI